MANQIRLKRASGSDPSASDLVTGELAVRTDTAKLFTKKDDNSVVEIGGISDGDKGDITVSNSGATFTIDANAITAGKIPNSEITLAKITDIPQNRIAGRISSGSGVIQELTAANVRTIINVEDGATADQSASEIVALIASQTIAPTKATFPDGNSNGIVIGDGSDLKLFHNGSHSYVENVTGNLNLTSTSSIGLLTNDTENSVVCNANSGVELYFNNVKKFESTVRGVEISGNTTNPLSSLSDGSTITVDFGASCNFTVTLGGNRTFGDPDNTASSVGSSGSIFIVQDGTGSRTASFHSDYKFAGGTAPTLSTAANAVDRLDYIVRASDNVHCVVTLDVK